MLDLFGLQCFKLAGMSGEASVNPALKTLAQKHLKVGAPAGFTENVMAGIAQVPRLSPYQPVLSKKVLMSIAASVVLLISVIFLTARPKASAQELHLQNKWSEVITELSRASHPWILAIIVAGALLYTDFLLNSNRRHQLER